MSAPKPKTFGVIDIGGTKISYAIFESKAANTPAISIQKIATQIGKSALLKQISTLINHYALTHHCADWVIGCPGNIKNGIIQPGSANNLSQHIGEFDNLNIRNAINELIDPNIHIQIINDAQLQFQGIINQLPYPKLNDLKGSTLCYIGPGTGLGGGLATLNNIETRTLSFFTDGHIYDIRLGDNGKTAEDLISGRALYKKTGLSGAQLTNNIDLLRKHTRFLIEMGHHLGQLIIQLHEGETSKKYPALNWSQVDRDKIKGCRYIFLGGSLVGYNPIGDLVINGMSDTLKKYPNDIHIYRSDSTTHPALYGASNLRVL